MCWSAYFTTVVNVGVSVFVMYMHVCACVGASDKSWRACICDVHACMRVCSFVRMCMCVRMYTHTHVRALLLHEARITDASDCILLLYL